MHARRPRTPAASNRVVKIALDKLNMWKAGCFCLCEVARDSADWSALRRQSLDDFAAHSSSCSGDQYHSLFSQELGSAVVGA